MLVQGGAGEPVRTLKCALGEPGKERAVLAGGAVANYVSQLMQAAKKISAAITIKKVTDGVDG